MKPAHRSELRKIYDKLKIELLNQASSLKSLDGSLIKKFIHSSNASKTKPAYLRVGHHIADKDLAKELEDIGYVIRNHERYHEHTITAFGLWEYELNKGVVSVEQLMSIVHNKYFETLVKPLRDLEKIALASLLFSRIFSKDVQIKLNENRDHNYNIHWYDITVAAMTVLKRTNRIKSTNHKFVGNSNKTYLWVRVNDLPSHTNGLYYRGNSGDHYLDIFNKKIDTKKLKSLYEYIFGNKFESESEFLEIKRAIKTFSRENRYKISQNSKFTDRSTTKILIDTFDQLLSN